MLDEIVDFFALCEGVEEDRCGTEIHPEAADAKKVGRNAGQFAADDSNRLAARGQFPAHKFLHSQGVGHIVRDRGEVIQSVRIGDELVVLHVFRDFLIATVQIANIRSRLGHDFTIQFQNHAKHTVSRWVRGPHVQHEFLAKHFVGFLHGLQAAGQCVGMLECGCRHSFFCCFYFFKNPSLGSADVFVLRRFFPQQEKCKPHIFPLASCVK